MRILNVLCNGYNENVLLYFIGPTQRMFLNFTFMLDKIFHIATGNLTGSTLFA